MDNDCDGVIPADELDSDGDGYSICQGDCDDTNATIYPGAPELIDGLDNDCDGVGDGVNDVVGGLEDLIDSGVLPSEVVDAIQNAIDNLIGNNGGAASNGALDQIDLENFNSALVKLGAAIEALILAESLDGVLDLTAEKQILALAGAAVVEQAIENANTIATSPKDFTSIAEAEGLLAVGEGLVSSGAFLTAIETFQEALTHLKSPPKKKRSLAVPHLSIRIIQRGLNGLGLRRVISGPPGITIDIERSVDLIHWDRVERTSVPDGGVLIQMISVDHAVGFYRVQLTQRTELK